MNKQNKKAQVTLFIILAIVIVVIGVLIYAFVPGIKSPTISNDNPYVFISQCLEDKIEDTATTLSLQGGSLNPEGTYTYLGNEIEYLCYTNKNYQLCTVQRPFLQKHIEEEIQNAIKENADACFLALKENYDSGAILKSGTIQVDLLPGRILTTFSHEFTTNKKGSTTKYDEFKVVLNSGLYQLTSIADKIVDQETTRGEADVLTYMMLYRDLKIQKLKQTDDTKIYILENKNTKEKFQFASRSLAFPPGY